jgi:hypothetical protein
MNLKDSRLISSIKTIFRCDERLTYFFLHHKKAEPRLGADDLLKEAESLSFVEYLLIQAALDFWSGEGQMSLSSAMTFLDDESLIALVRGILYLREIDVEYLMDEDLC